MSTDFDQIRRQIRDHYARAARASGSGRTAPGDACCAEPAVFGPTLYSRETLDEAPDEAALASLGCGNPTAVAELRPGEVVLDLGSGGGLDVILSARRVGPGGKAYGMDMTEEMLALAIENKSRAGVDNVEFLKGYIEEIPLPANTVDVVISNCVINLSADKGQVLREAYRVLKPGGRLAVTDVVADRRSERTGGQGWCGCIDGALTRDEYRSGLQEAGFRDVEIVDTHAVAGGYASAIVRARKATSAPQGLAPSEEELEEVRFGCC